MGSSKPDFARVIEKKSDRELVMKNMHVLFVVLAAVVLAGCSKPSTAGDTADTSTFITVYPDGAAVVADSREVSLEAGRQTLQLTGLPDAFRPGTLWLAGDSVSLLASSFHQATDRSELLRTHLGKTVTLLRSDGSGGDVSRKATLLSAGGPPVVRMDGRVLWLNDESPWRIALSDVPESVPFQDSLALTLSVANGGEQALNLTYQMNGLSWSASYVARLDRDAEQLSIRGQAQIQNNTGKRWKHVGMALIAGEVNRTHEGARLMSMSAAAKTAAPGMQAESAGGYYRYTLEDPVTLDPGEQRNVTLFERQTIEVERQFVLTGSWRQSTNSGRRAHASIRLRFENTLDKPLPAGPMRVYGAEEQPMLLGAAHISNTPKKGVVTLALGQAFDITAERVTTEVDQDGSAREFQRKITLHNASERAVEVRVVERVPGDWKVLSATADYDKVDAHHIAWTVSVPAEGSTEIGYHVRYRT